MKKKLLFLSPCFPFPPYDGGKARLYHLLRRLARTNDVSLLSYVESPHVNEYVPALEEFGVKVATVVRDESKAIVSERLPRSISFFSTPEMIEKLEEVLATVRPDLVQIDFLVMSQYVNHIKNIPVVYTEHDMSGISFDQSFHDRDLPEKMRFAEWNKLVRFQREILLKFNRVFVLTERDRSLMNSFMPGVKTMLVPTGVDVDYFRPDASAGGDRDILFIGHYRHYPNYDAVCHFVRDILPHIVAEVPGVRFVVVGSGLKKESSELDGDNVKIIGEVEDVRRYLHAAEVFVVPVRLGGGINGKILEAMAAGLPVVATREAGTGIEYTPGIDMEVAENEKDFAARVIALLKNAGRREFIARNARNLVKQKYNWDTIAAQLDAFYDSIVTVPHETI